MVNFHTGNDDSAVDFGGSYFQTDPSHDAIEYGSGSNSYPPNYVNSHGIIYHCCIFCWVLGLSPGYQFDPCMICGYMWNK